MADVKSLYLFSGDDDAKIDAARARLRKRVEGEGGLLEVFEPVEGRGSPDADAFVAAIPAMSLTQTRRYLLVDGAEKWGARQLETVIAALEEMPPDLTAVLIARGKAPAKLVPAVEAGEGEVRAYTAPKPKEVPGRLVAEAKSLGFRLEPGAARALVDRMGTNLTRLGNELQRLALWAGEEGEVSEADLDEMVADTSEAAVWSLSDALIEGDSGRALRIAERLLDQGENVTGLVYALASRLRKASEALAQLEAGMPPKQVESGLGMHPYAARQLVAKLHDRSLDDLHAATEALADLEVWCRGGADYGDELALTLALRRAAA